MQDRRKRAICLSPLTLILAVGIPLSAIFARNILSLSYSVFGVEHTKDAISIFLGVLLVAVFCFCRSLARGRLILITFLFICVLAIGQLFYLPEENLHIAKYMLLGFLTLNDWKDQHKALVMSSLFAGLVGVADECIQYFVPDRVFDLRDILLDWISGTLGVFIAFTTNNKICKGRGIKE